MSNISEKCLKRLKGEISMAETLNEEELKPMMVEAIERYTGKHIPDVGSDWDIILNEVYPIIQNELPSIFFRNPHAFLKPKQKTYITKKRDPVSGKKVDVQVDAQKSARTQEGILNYNIEEMGYKRETRKVLLDALLFPHGILWHGYKGDFGMTEEQSYWIKDEKVFVKRISPSRFIKDPSVTMSNLDEARWVGRVIDIPFDDLLEDNKLNVNKKEIKGFVGYGDKVGGKKKSPTGDFVQPKPLLDSTTKEFKESTDAKFVRCYEIYLRPTKKEKREGSSGRILLLCEDQFKPLRDDPWKIKAEGFPSKVLQFNELNDSMFGMPDLDAYKSIADQKNIISNLQIRNAQENSKTWVGISKEGANEDDIEAVQQGTNTIVTFESENPRDRMFVANAGGNASSELYLLDQRIQKNLEDKSGVTDLKRGFLQSGEESATSVKLRAAGGGARPAYRQDLMSDFLKESFHYINQLLKQFVTQEDAVRVMGTLDIEWTDNLSKEELQADVDVDIDVISMLPENPEKEVRELNTVLQLVVQALTSPEIRAKLGQEGKTIEISPIIEQLLIRLRIKDPNVFRNIRPEDQEGYVKVSEMNAAKANVQAALQGSQQLPSPPQPGQDHRARIDVYSTVLTLIQEMGDSIAKQLLTQLVQMQRMIQQKEAEKQNNKPGTKVTGLDKPKIQTVGTV